MNEPIEEAKVILSKLEPSRQDLRKEHAVLEYLRWRGGHKPDAKPLFILYGFLLHTHFRFLQLLGVMP